MEYIKEYGASDNEEESFSMVPGFFYTSKPVISIEQYNASDISSNEDRFNPQMSKIVVDPAPYLESKPVTPKGNSLSIE